MATMEDTTRLVQPRGMNPRHTFESFVGGGNNQFAHAAALAVAESAAKTYNPLFIYGGVGLGKTHLIQAIGQHIASREQSAKVIYLSTETFVSEFIDAIRSGTLVEFRKRFRQADVLLIEDIHLLAGKECAEEFLQTFNALFDGHKQIVLSSDRPPAELAQLGQGLLARFEWGLTAELQPPDLETRMTILRNSAASFSVRLDDTIIEFLAQRIRTDIRRLLGALMRVASFSLLSGHDPTLETVEHLLQDIFRGEASPI